MVYSLGMWVVFSFLHIESQEHAFVVDESGLKRTQGWVRLSADVTAVTCNMVADVLSQQQFIDPGWFTWLIPFLLLLILLRLCVVP